MADLPIDTADVPPFTSCGTDYFGPYLVVRGRGKSRVYFSLKSSSRGVISGGQNGVMPPQEGRYPLQEGRYPT